MSRASVAAFALLLAACGGNAATASPSPTVAPTTAPTASPTSAPTASPSPSPEPTAAVPAGFKLATGDGFQIALPEAWTVTLNPDTDTLLKAQSPLGGSRLSIYRSEGLLKGKTLRAYFEESKGIFEGLWDTSLVRSETTVGGVPALRGDAQQSFLGDVNHVLFYLQPDPSVDELWSLDLDTDGLSADPALETIIGSFQFNP